MGHGTVPEEDGTDRGVDLGTKAQAGGGWS